MPIINEYKCNKCDLRFRNGWGGYMYVEDDNKKRIVCPHPAEYNEVRRVLGPDASQELIASRTGFNSDCYCLDCKNTFFSDIGDEQGNIWRKFYDAERPKDERKCPDCGSVNIKTLAEMIGAPCPKCKTGTIIEKSTFTMC
jgi:DNA-directed RNA polymerase subunit RPC12/RpoP